MSDYEDYLDVIDELEKLDTIITVPKYRRCCYNSLELLKLTKNLNNVNGGKQRRISY